MAIAPSTKRMASTAALSAAFLSPRPAQRAAAMAAASVTRIISRAILRSGFDGGCIQPEYSRARSLARGNLSFADSGNTCRVISVVVKPSGPLCGEVQAFGAKNAVLKQMAACLLASGQHQLTNVPDITDVSLMIELLVALGCSVERPVEHELLITVPDANDLHPIAPAHLFEAMRASIVVLGPLLARCGEANMALPGGDDFGHRPINFHTDGLSAMGATFRNDRNSIHASTNRPRLRATHITLEYPSHTATDNLLMACVLAEGRSVIENAAREPEVEDLGRHGSVLKACANLAPRATRSSPTVWSPRRTWRPVSSPGGRCGSWTDAPTTW